MANIRFESAAAFSTRLGEIDDALTQEDKWVNDKLEVVNKDCGFVRFWKVIVLPIARFFGADPFGHVRIHIVALVLLEEYQNQSEELSDADAERVKHILESLSTRVHHRKKPREKNQRSLHVAFFAIFHEDLPTSAETQTPTPPPTTPNIPTPPLPPMTTSGLRPLPPTPKKKENDTTPPAEPSSPAITPDALNSAREGLKRVDAKEVNRNKPPDTMQTILGTAMEARRQFIHAEDDDNKENNDDDNDDWLP